MKVYIKNEIYLNRKPEVIDDCLSEGHLNFTKECGMYMIDIMQIESLSYLIKSLIKALNMPNIYPFITPIDNSLILTFRQINRDTMCFK